MNHIFRVFVATLLMLCLSCSSMFGPLVTVRQGFGKVDQPQIPEPTLTQFKDCGELVQEGLKPGPIPIDARIEVDGDGRVLGATTKGEPNPEVGICLRLALREMRVDPDVIDHAKRQAMSSSAPNVSTIPSRMHIGQVVEVVTVTVITVVYVEVFIEVSMVVLAVAVTATVDLAAKAVLAASAPARKPQQPVAEKWKDKGGTIQQNADGSTTYTRSDGVAVTYDKEGYPDFTPYRHPTVKDVQIEFTGSYPKDYALADKAADITEKMRKRDGYTWHHHQDGKTMQLLKKDVHRDFFHTGGMAGTRQDCDNAD
jgi:DNase/tRNase domain of colicin-like bacteriocin